MLPNVREIETRLRSLEQQLERVGDRTSASTAEVVERVGAAIAPVLSNIADRFRGGAHSMRDEAAKLGNDALRRLSNEVEHRPLFTLAVAVSQPFRCCRRAARSRATTPPTTGAMT
jgi:hypothetical protein